VPVTLGEAAGSAVSSSLYAPSLRTSGAGIFGTDGHATEASVSQEEVTPAAWALSGGSTPLGARSGNESTSAAAAAAAAGLSPGASQVGDAEPSPLTTSRSGITRARSFHGVNPGPAGISGGGAEVGREAYPSGGGLVSLAQAGRAATTGQRQRHDGAGAWAQDDDDAPLLAGAEHVWL